jgi:hypothetical protein
MTIEAQGDDDWLILNPAWIRYFIVEYTPEAVEALAVQLEADDKVIPKDYKLMIIEKIHKYLTKINALKALKSLTFLRRSNDVDLWDKGVKIIYSLEEFLVGTDMFSKFQNFAQWLTEENLKQIGFEPKIGEPENDSTLRSRLVNLSCYLNSMDCLQLELKKLEAFLPNLIFPKKEIRLCDAFKLANISVHRLILEDFDDYDYFERLTFIGCSVHHQIIQLHLNAIYVNALDLNLLKAVITRSATGMRTGLTFIDKNLKKL